MSWRRGKMRQRNVPHEDWPGEWTIEFAGASVL